MASTERIRCKADYKVAGTGLSLKQALHCASDGYKFDLTSDVTSQGEQISGNWSETNRNIFGNLQGTAGGSRSRCSSKPTAPPPTCRCAPTAPSRRCRSARKGEIRGVNITMTKG